MKNATQLKALIKNLAKDKGIPAQIIMMYLSCINYSGKMST